ncbi:MAG: hypothetical protein MJ094_05605 [Saccharofermentans sp.]|nr:hypothetical protein [Saccharofermentans sp.]
MIELNEQDRKRISELDALGYKLGKISDFSFSSNLNEKEKSLASEFKAKTLQQSSFMMITLISISILVIIATLITGAPIIIPAFIVPVSVVATIMLLVRSLGPKKITYATVLVKAQRRKSSRDRPIFYLVAYQDSPKKIYASYIFISQAMYKNVNAGDRVAIIKSSLDFKVYKED